MNKIHKSWKSIFDQYEIDIDQIYIKNDIYPPKESIFKVFEMDVKDIQILLLGQDPYHGENQAHGLSFSVPSNTKIPPSLRNIFKELNLEFPERNYIFKSGNLEKWFYKEKIFLLNSSLSVIKGRPGSQMNLWEEFTNDVIRFISDNNETCIFLLLGNFAKAKSKFIKNKSLIINGIHPSPLARGFIGSNIFKNVETLLNKQIDWSN
jgi:uracil-DNA glycosylase